MSANKLTAKQAAFVREYCIDWNATQAAIRAGYSEKTARQIGEQNLSKLDIKKAIEDRTQKSELKAIRTAEQILADVQLVKDNAMRIVEGNMANHAAALKALELEGKHVAMWTDKHDHSNSDGTLRPTVIEIVPYVEK
jgi:phage terminase small subunit